MTPPDPAAREAADEQKWEKVIPNLYRVRVPSGWIYQGSEDTSSMCFVPDPVTIHGAAEKRAEEMAARVKVLEAALEPFANAANGYDGIPPPKYFGDTDCELRYYDDMKCGITLGNLRNARAALAQETP